MLRARKPIDFEWRKLPTGANDGKSEFASIQHSGGIFSVIEGHCGAISAFNSVNGF